MDGDYLCRVWRRILRISWPAWFGMITGAIAAAAFFYASADSGSPVVVSVPLALAVGLVVGAFWYWMERNWGFLGGESRGGGFLDFFNGMVLRSFTDKAPTAQEMHELAERGLTTEERGVEPRTHDDNAVHEPPSAIRSWLERIGLLVAAALFTLYLVRRVKDIIESLPG